MFWSQTAIWYGVPTDWRQRGQHCEGYAYPPLWPPESYWWTRDALLISSRPGWRRVHLSPLFQHLTAEPGFGQNHPGSGTSLERILIALPGIHLGALLGRASGSLG